VVGFDPYKIDTVIHNNIANNRKLIYAGDILKSIEQEVSN
jgi:hypothetical protein